MACGWSCSLHTRGKTLCGRSPHLSLSPCRWSLDASSALANHGLSRGNSLHNGLAGGSCFTVKSRTSGSLLETAQACCPRISALAVALRAPAWPGWIDGLRQQSVSATGSGPALVDP